MAKDNAAPEGGDEGIIASGDVLELDTPVKPPEDDDSPPEPTVEGVASELGWVPKDKFKGDEKDWKPAVDFIREGKNIQKGLAKDVKGLRSQMDTMAKTSATLFQERLEQERERLTAQHLQAVEEGDADAAFKISQRISRVDSQANQAAAPSTEAEEWVQRNSWMKTHPLANAIAIQTAEQYARAGKSTAEQLQAAEDEVRRAYPHLFGTQKQAPGVSQPGPRSAAPSNRAKGFADMPKPAQDVAKDMVDRGLIPDVESYTRNYWASEGKAR